MPSKSKVKDVLVTFNATAEQRQKWKTFAASQSKTLTELITEYLEGCCAGGGVLTVGDAKAEKARVQAEDEMLERQQLLMDCGGYSWPVGDISKVSREVKIAKGFGSKVVWSDEVGNLYDENLELLNGNGSNITTSGAGIGGGMLRYMNTIQPALRGGWKPEVKTASVLTLNRVLHVLRGKVSWPELASELTAELASRGLKPQHIN